MYHTTSTLFLLLILNYNVASRLWARYDCIWNLSILCTILIRIFSTTSFWALLVLWCLRKLNRKDNSVYFNFESFHSYSKDFHMDRNHTAFSKENLKSIYEFEIFFYKSKQQTAHKFKKKILTNSLCTNNSSTELKHTVHRHFCEMYVLLNLNNFE